MTRFASDHWALILGGSSGFGLASARKLSAEGLNVFVVHRDRRGAMERVDQEFAAIRSFGRGFASLNLDALTPEGMAAVIDGLKIHLGATGRVRLLLHSIAFGSLKPIAPPPPERTLPMDRLADALGLTQSDLHRAVRRLADEGELVFQALQPVEYSETLIDDEDLARTIFAMGTSLLSWVQRLHALALFADDARVIGLTSEGNATAWRGYAAVAAAKSALESLSRAIAVEFGPHGIRSNIIQAGITDTPALRMVPGSARMKAGARLRNPLGRLTVPEDVANMVYLLSLDEAAWVNGALVRVDGGEHIA